MSELDDQYNLFINRLNRILPNSEDFLVSVGKSPSNIEYNPGRHFIDPNIKYVVRWFYEKNVFAVWDYSLHRCKPAGKTLNLTDNWSNFVANSSTFYYSYKNLGYAYSKKFEKVCVIGIDWFDEFFLNIDAYMSFNDQDDGFLSFYASVDNDEKKRINDIVNRRPLRERKLYSCSRKSRDAQFRKEVLDAYGHRCAICRTDVEDILQAAHEHKYEVASTAYDDPKHGICLCANHHLMYDNDLIDIDLKTLSITINDEKLFQTTWYQEFVNNGGKILVRKD